MSSATDKTLVELGEDQDLWDIYLEIKLPASSFSDAELAGQLLIRTLFESIGIPLDRMALTDVEETFD